MKLPQWQILVKRPLRKQKQPWTPIRMDQTAWDSLSDLLHVPVNRVDILYEIVADTFVSVINSLV
ncbi:MAG: hypothetical protein HOE30_05380 [Deltaproteobacteria bacterium]|nr:hypothetical protein [Deltaproteobacteria bacterium]